MKRIQKYASIDSTVLIKSERNWLFDVMEAQIIWGTSSFFSKGETDLCNCSASPPAAPHSPLVIPQYVV